MKKTLINNRNTAIATFGLLTLLSASQSVFANTDPVIDLYYEDPVVKKGTKSKLNWNIDSQYLDSCTYSGKKLSSYTKLPIESTRNLTGVGSSFIQCNINGKTIKKNAYYYAIHNGPSNFSDYQTAGGGRRYVTDNNDVPTLTSINGYCTATAFSDFSGKCKDSDYIYVPGDAIIEIPNNTSRITLEEGVTLFSNRGFDGSSGARIIYKHRSANAAIRMKSNSRITGFRIVGPTPPSSDRNMTYAGGDEIGIVAGYIRTFDNNNNGYNEASPHNNISNVTIDNNEIYNWTFAGVHVGYGATGVTIKNNFIHDNRGAGYGYGIQANGTLPSNAQSSDEIKIEKNVFIRNRHDIASSGYAGNSYNATKNIVFDGTYSYWSSPEDNHKPRYDHRFDVHGCIDRDDHTCEYNGDTPQANQNITNNYPHNTVIKNGSATEDYTVIENGTEAGHTFNIEDNIFSLRNTDYQRAFVTRGNSFSQSTITNNWFSHKKELANNNIGVPLTAGEHGGALEMRWYIYNGNCRSVCGRTGYIKTPFGQISKWDHVSQSTLGTMNYTITGSKVEN